MNPFKNIPIWPDAASTVAGQVDTLYIFLVVLSAFFSLLIAALVVGFGLTYRRRSEDQVGTPETTSTPLELTWSIIPLIISLVIFVWGAKLFVTLQTPPSDAVEYYAVGKQWMWKFQHPQGNREINDLHIPVGQAIKLKMTSEDVIHSFFVPEFRVKQDVLPGRYTTLWFEATKPGVYRIFCAEYCGAEHSRMIGKVYALSQADYEAWLGGKEPGKTVLASGEELFTQLACITCHRGDDTARGPILANLEGGTVELRGGRSLTRDDSYLRESILTPSAKIVNGFEPLMPSYQGQVTEEQLLALIKYLKTINQGPPGAQTAAASTPSAAADKG